MGRGYFGEIFKLLKNNLKNLVGWRQYWPAKNSKPTVLMVPVYRVPEPFYQSWQQGIESAGWNFICLYRQWNGIQVCDQVLIFILLCLRVEVVHFVDLDLQTLFGTGEKIRTRASFWLLRFLVFWPKLVGRRVIYSFGNIAPHDLNSAAERRRHKLICSLVQDVTCHYPASKDELIGLGIEEGRIWPAEHAEIAGYYQFPTEWPDPREALNISEGVLAIGFIGTIRRYKGLDVLLREFSLTENPELRLVIAGKPGGGYSERDLQELAMTDRRIILGPLRHLGSEEMGWMLSGLDFFALPYHDVGLSGQVCLGLSLGLPVIGSRVGCLTDYLESGAGLLFNPAKPGDLAEQLERLKDFDCERAKQIGLRMMRQRPAEVIGRRLVKIYQYRKGGEEPDKRWLF